MQRRQLVERPVEPEQHVEQRAEDAVAPADATNVNRCGNAKHATAITCAVRRRSARVSSSRRDTHRNSDRPYSASMIQYGTMVHGQKREASFPVEHDRRHVGAHRRRPVGERVGAEEERGQQQEPAERAAPGDHDDPACDRHREDAPLVDPLVDLAESGTRDELVELRLRAPPHHPCRAAAVAGQRAGDELELRVPGLAGVEQDAAAERASAMPASDTAPASCRERARRGRRRCRSWAADQGRQARAVEGIAFDEARDPLELAGADQRVALLDVGLAVVAQQDGIGQGPRAVEESRTSVRRRRSTDVHRQPRGAHARASPVPATPRGEACAGGCRATRWSRGSCDRSRALAP